MAIKGKRELQGEGFSNIFVSIKNGNKGKRELRGGDL